MQQPREFIHLKDGKAYTINRNVKVKMIAIKHFDAGESIEDIAEHYGIEIADVYGALAYYFDNKAEFDANEQRLDTLIKQEAISSRDHLAQIRARYEAKQKESAQE